MSIINCNSCKIEKCQLYICVTDQCIPHSCLVDIVLYLIVHVQYLTLLTITVLPLATVYFVSEVHYNLLHSITLQYYAITYKCKWNFHITMIMAQLAITLLSVAPIIVHINLIKSGIMYVWILQSSNALIHLTNYGTMEC